jgi:hypothetical protein
VVLVELAKGGSVARLSFLKVLAVLFVFGGAVADAFLVLLAVHGVDLRNLLFLRLLQLVELCNVTLIALLGLARMLLQRLPIFLLHFGH